MKIVEKIDELRVTLDRHRNKQEKIGFVPTMGYFHEGHLSLMDKAREEADIVVVSVYVNPTQFAPNEDLDRYPRDIERDRKLAQERGVDYIFHPDNQEMYSENFSTYVKNVALSDKLCGASRDNHFQGVTTIVSKLFNIVDPDFAVFGQKDYQQAVIIKKMVKDLNFGVDILLGDIIREEDGLATSSRNTYLSKEERNQAPVLYKALQGAKEKVEAGENSAEKVRKFIQNTINEAELADIEYVSIVDDENLVEVEHIKKGTVAAVAVWFGDTRLIDNIILK